MPTLSQKAAYWERELLDLSKRNRMLHFRETKRSSLVIETPDFFSMYEKIVKEEQLLTFQHPVGRDIDPRAYYLLQLFELAGSPVEVLIGDIHTNQNIHDQMLTLRSLRNKAQLAFDEQGTNLLYLSFGFIRWYDGDKKAGEMNSPFLLVPVSFSGNGAYDFELKLYEDDITINPTLIYALEQKKHFSFPEFDSEKDSFKTYIGKLIPLLEKAGMRLEQKCCLGILSFLKINMYLDLKKNNSRIASNPVLQEIYAPRGIAEKPEFNHDEEPYENRWQVLSADSSQMDAISLSRQGKSFVLQGPPGTGKSQTITNIIAQALADGKKVLFVSEKMAALQVVYRRLEEVGLGDFCLPLHDYKADKKQILHLIAKPLTLKKKNKNPDADAKIARLEMLKRKLNLYPQDMHKVQSKYQMSIYEAMSRLEELQDIPACNVGFKKAHDIDRLSLLKLQDSITEFGRIIQSLSINPRENPWHGYKTDSFLPEERRKVQELIETYLQAVNDAMLLTAQAQEEYRLPVQATPRELQHMAALLMAILYLPVLPQAWIDLDTDVLATEAENEKRIQQAFWENKNSADAFFTAYPPMEKAEEWTKTFDQFQMRLHSFGVSMDSLAHSNDLYTAAIDQIGRFIQAWEKEAGLFWRSDRPVSAANDLYRLLSFADQITVFSPLWLKTESRNQAQKIFQESYTHQQHIQQILAVLTASGSTAESEADLREAYETWSNTISDEVSPNIFSILQKSWQISHPPVFSSIPPISTMAWVRQMEQLIQSLHPSAEFQLDQVDAGLEACVKATATLGRIQHICKPFADLLPDQKFGDCVRFLTSLPAFVDRMPIPFTWLKQKDRNTAFQILSQFSALQSKIKEQKESILKDYHSSVFELPATEMLGRFEIDYTSFFGRHSAQKKKDLQAIQMRRKSSVSAIHDLEACRILKSVCQLKETEHSYQTLWQQNMRLFSNGQPAIPEDWITIKNKLSDFDQFCKQEKYAYIERMTQEMLNEVPTAVSALHSISFSELLDALSLWLPDAAQVSVTEVQRRIEEKQLVLWEITEQFQLLTDCLHDGVANRQAYTAMQSLAQEQNQALLHSIALLHQLSEEKQSYDNLKEQRKLWLGPAWEEDDPQWSAFNCTFNILTLEELQGILAEIAEKTPEISLQTLRQWHDKLNSFAPEKIEKLILAANSNIRRDASANEQYDLLRSGHDEIRQAMLFMESVSSYVPQKASASEIRKHMTCLAEMHTLIQEQDARQNQCMLRYGDTYAGWSTDWDRVCQDLKRWKLCKTQFPEIEKQISIYRPIIASPDRDGYAIWSDHAIHVVGTWLDSFAEIEGYFEQGTFSGLTQVEKEERLSQAADHMEYLDQWLRYAIGKQKIFGDGLEKAVSTFEKQIIPPQLYGQAYEKSFLLAWINQAMGGTPELTQFDAREKDADIESYRHLYEEYLTNNRIRLQSVLIDRVPKQEAGGEMAILKKELTKKAKLMPLRKLFRQIPYLLMKLKPCLMMSPLSVSYFLDSDFYHFDMVIFDEASQIFPQDAIGAILRGDQAIIAGDTRQMPPTDFFSTETEEEEEDEENEEVSTPLGDSILEEADYTLTPQQLLWHYRSKDEQLIAFSNQHFYEDHLYTFPSNTPQKVDMGVEFVFVPDGVYAKRHNDKEAQACLRLIREHYERHPERSLGVVAFNEAQQSTIENLIWEERERDPFFASLLDENQTEPFFIKNLENVQGDERDTIIFSICFGRAADGKFRYNFGPLGKAGGERRLNVAVTRAKCNVKLVASIHAQDIDLNRAKSDGARMLRNYIDYASHNEKGKLADGIDQDTFVKSVAHYLESQGYQIHQNVGRSAYTVDIAVCSRENPSQYTAAVQCDGSNYASARTACDREEIRRTMLEKLDWRIVNCWSADWFAHPAEARKMLMDQLKQKQPARSPKAVQRSDSAPAISSEDIQQDIASLIPTAVSKLPEYQLASQARYLSLAYPARYSEYMKRILHCIRYEQPISQELLYKRMAPMWNRQVASSYVRDQVNERLEQLGSDIKLIQGYYVLADFREAEPRTAGDREIDQISLEELEADLTFVIKQAFGMERQEVLTNTARVMGYQRTGPKIISRLSEALDRLLAGRKITIVQDKVQWKEEDA